MQLSLQLAIRSNNASDKLTTADSESESSDPTYSPTAPDRNPFGACELSPGPCDVGPASAMEQEDMKDDELPSDDDSASDGDQSDYVPDNKI